MLRRLIWFTVAAAAVGLAVFWFVTVPATVPASALGPHTPDLANGRMMFHAGGCSSCHAGPDIELAKKDAVVSLGGGRALGSPFGTFYVPNISADAKDGIGGWSEAQFVTAMVKGTSPSGQHLYPAFPYTSYQRISFADLRDMFAYLKTMPAVAGRARDHDLPFPFNIRRTLGGWKFLFLDGKPFVANAAQSAEWNRGAYLVNGPSHCAECHSPRNALGAIDPVKRFGGGPAPDGKGWVPNITQYRLNGWSVADIAGLLSSGMTPEFDFVGGTMAEVVRNTAQLSEADRNAMAVYIKSLAPVDQAPPPKQ